MGMMILRHFNDREHDDDESDDSGGEAEDRERGAADGASISDEPENNKKAKTEKEDDDSAEDAKDQSDDEECEENEKKVPAKPNGMNVMSEDTGNAVPAVEKEDEKTENGLRKKQENHEDIKMSVDGESSKANTNENMFAITPEESKSSDLDDIVMAGDFDCDKDDHNKKEDSESDYESGEELPESHNTDEHQSRRDNAVLDIERILALNVQRVRERITSELGALGSHDDNEINPPDAPSFDTDDDDDDDMQVDFLESLKRRARSSCPPRKLRYSSNTSVDTSTTSGIGSYTDDHLDAEMASHMDDSQKTSPGAISMDGPELGKSRSKRQQMDCSDSEDGEGEESDEKEESFPKETLGKFLCESVESLPLPTALRSYLMYYRN